MENVSEALKMAAGMLMAILLIALIVYVFHSISGMENAKRDQKVQQEATEFNKRFSAFDKSSMYGTDVISVIGLAISNNKIYNQQNTANPLGNYNPNSQYSINIKFRVPNDIKKKKIKEVIEVKQQDTDFDGIVDSQVENVMSTTILSEQIVLSAGEHTLTFDNEKLATDYSKYRTDNTKIEGEYRKYKNIEDIALNGNKMVNIFTKTHGTTLTRITEDLSGYNELKSVIYRCTQVKYNDVGRIYYMEFEPK